MVYWHFWGMRFFWWLLLAFMLVLLFTAFAPASRGRARLDEDPDTILRRRYARGELSTAEYEERLVVLGRTARQPLPTREPSSRESATPPTGATPAPSAT